MLQRHRRLEVALLPAILWIGCGLDEPSPDELTVDEASADSTQAIAWAACPGAPDPRQQCAKIEVPLDYHAPRGRTIELAISRLSAVGPGRRGVLLLNPGGPGTSGLDLPSLLGAVLPDSVRERYDLIGFDPRFVGASTPLTCELSDAQQGPLDQPAGFDATARFARRIAEQCRAAAGDVLPFATTANAARDMDRIRRALGESRISYLGYSYGTYLGAVYSSLFPARVDRFVLDSAVDPTWTWRLMVREWGSAADLRFTDFAAFAVAHADDYHFGTSEAAVRRFTLELIDSLDRAPATLPDGTVMTGAELRQLTFQGLYGGDEVFPQIAALWQATIAARTNPGRSPAPRAGSDNELASGYAVFCSDVAWPRSISQYRRELAHDVAQFPLFGPIGSTIWPCAFWSTQPREPLVQILGTGPANILILQHLRDPATPYGGALGMRSALGARARMVGVDEGGHGVYAVRQNGCANAAGTGFLAHGTLPSHDMMCPAEPAGAAAGATEALRRRLGTVGFDRDMLAR